MQPNIPFSDAGVNTAVEKKRKVRERPTLNLPPRFGVTPAADVIGVHPNTLRRLIAKGEAPEHVLINGRAMFTEAAIQEWLDARRSA